jgi:uncharacterized protein (TIGR02118 family)
VVRLVCLLKRKAGLSPEEFGAYWRDEHGPLVAGHQARLNLLRYSQVHRDPSAEAADLKARELRGGMLPPYDGVTEMWWSSEEALRAAMATDGGARALAELIADEDRFVDLAASPLWFAHEYPQVSTQRDRPVASPKSGTVRVTLPLRPLPSLTDAEARSYWLTVHGPIVRSHAVARGAICYQQVHRYETGLADELAAQRGAMAEPFLGYAEAWFDWLTPRTGPEADAATAAAVGDEHNFIDFDRSTFWTSKELVFVDRDWR